MSPTLQATTQFSCFFKVTRKRNAFTRDYLFYLPSFEFFSFIFSLHFVSSLTNLLIIPISPERFMSYFSPRPYFLSPFSFSATTHPHIPLMFSYVFHPFEGFSSHLLPVSFPHLLGSRFSAPLFFPFFFSQWYLQFPEGPLGF